jgi:hypothetical protein
MMSRYRSELTHLFRHGNFASARIHDEVVLGTEWALTTLFLQKQLFLPRHVREAWENKYQQLSSSAAPRAFSGHISVGP